MLSSLFDLPEMAGVKHAPSPYGEDDMAVQNISQIMKWDNLVVASPIPEEYGRYLDAVAAVPSKAAHQDLGAQFIAYATQPGTFAIWYSRGVDPRKGKE